MEVYGVMGCCGYMVSWGAKVGCLVSWDAGGIWCHEVLRWRCMVSWGCHGGGVWCHVTLHHLSKVEPIHSTPGALA